MAFLSCGTSTSSTINTGITTEQSQTGSQVVVESNTEMPTELQVNCSDKVNNMLPGPGVSKTGNGSLTYAGSETALSAAVIDEENHNNVSEVGIVMHNGNSRSLKQSDSDDTGSVTRIDWGVYNANIVLITILSQIDTPTFTGGNFDIISAPNTEEFSDIPSDTNAANVVIFTVDKNTDGIANLEEESQFATSGNINVSGESPNWSVTVDLTLADGTTLTGGFDGDFNILPAFDE